MGELLLSYCSAARMAFWAGFCTVGDGLRLWDGEERSGGEQRTVAADNFFGDSCPQVSIVMRIVPGSLGFWWANEFHLIVDSAITTS